MACFRCGRRATDPLKGKSLWGKFVTKGEQVLICPTCQSEMPGWRELADRCPECGSDRLQIVMGSFVCRQCGADFDSIAKPAE